MIKLSLDTVDLGDLLRAAISLRHYPLGEQYFSGVGKFTTVG